MKTKEYAKQSVMPGMGLTITKYESGQVRVCDRKGKLLFAVYSPGTFTVKWLEVGLPATLLKSTLDTFFGEEEKGYCPHCHKPLGQNYKHCPFCERDIAQAGTYEKETACLKCHGILEAHYKFCPHCGHKQDQEIVMWWRTGEGKFIRLKDMTDAHLANLRNWLSSHMTHKNASLWLKLVIEEQRERSF